MAYSLNLNGTVVEATITGGSEASPNLASGLADAIMADGNATIAAKAYRSGDLMWFEELKIIISAGGWFKWDDDAKIELRTDFQSAPQSETSSNANDGGAVIFGLRSVIHMKVSVRRNDAAVYAVSTGGTLIFKRDLHGVNPQIGKENTNRNDYPTFNRNLRPGRVILEGLSYKLIVGSSSSQKWYFGLSRNALGDDVVANLQVSGGGEIFQIHATTYQSPSVPEFKMVGDQVDNVVRILNGNFNSGSATNRSFNGAYRNTRVYIDSPTFPAVGSGFDWNGQLTQSFNSNANGAHCAIRWEQSLDVIDGVSPISGASVRITTKVNVAGAGYDLSLIQEVADQQPSAIDATTAGSTLSWKLIDAFIARRTAGQGDTTGADESYKYDMQVRKYEDVGNDYVFQDRIYGYQGLLSNADNTFIMTADSNIGTITKNSAQGLSDINNANELYAAAKYYWTEDDDFQTPSILVSRAGDLIDAGAYDVDIDATAFDTFSFVGNKITISSPNFTGDMVTTGVITLLNGATFSGSRTDANGTVAPPKIISVTGMVVGSRLCVYNATTATEVVNQIIAGNDYSSTYDEGVGYSVGDTLSLRVAKINQNEYSTNVLVGSTGWSALIEQSEDLIYTDLAIDGSAVTRFAADYVNDEIDVVVSSNFEVSELYAWYKHISTSSQGISDFFGGITALNQANFRINNSVVNLFIDNTTTTNIRQIDNRRFYRSDESYPVKEPTSGGGGIDIVWRNTILIAETGVSGLTTSESTLLNELNKVDGIDKLTKLIPATL
tara:strand:+ start:2719 stop:5055 length:2337 start_codon:yes stop_codon:yes gene_type:complete